MDLTVKEVQTIRQNILRQVYNYLILIRYHQYAQFLATHIEAFLFQQYPIQEYYKLDNLDRLFPLVSEMAINAFNTPSLSSRNNNALLKKTDNVNKYKLR